MLWSGNCRPGNDALAVCESLGMANLNGGNTMVTHERNSLANISPRAMTWGGDHLQIYTSMQNEFVYTNNWSGPFYGGFARVIDTFERTEQPRRLKPVNIYYHFYSAGQLGSLKAVKRAYNWCLKQRLHSVTARQYCDMVRDCRETVILKSGERSWKLISAGNNRTFRVPKAAGTAPGRAARRRTRGLPESGGRASSEGRALPG